MNSNPLKEKLQDYEAVIFDLDGTLVDSMWMWKEIDRAYLANFGIELPDNLQKEIEGMGLDETAVYFKEKFGITDTVEKMRSDWISMALYKHSHEVPMKPGAQRFLSYCMEKGIKLGIATSNSLELVERIEEAHHLKDYISCIVTGCQVENCKPAPDIYLVAAKRLHTDPKKCLVFEDIIPGIMAGKAAGMSVCAVWDEHSEKDWDEKVKTADFSLRSYEEIL